MPEGCSWLVERKLFADLGGFDSEFFMYSDEYEFAFRLWISGRKAIAVPAARLHHRGAANVNPAGGAQVVEFRTSDTKRFYANRNGLLVILKNAQHVLLLLAVTQTALLLLEALAALVLVRRWSFIQRAYLNAFRDVWRLRHHVCAGRKKIQAFRRRSDWGMLRFLRWRPNRLEEVLQMWRKGPPKVTSG
jgi:GT2 family glycosyltransferase